MKDVVYYVLHAQGIAQPTTCRGAVSLNTAAPAAATNGDMSQNEARPGMTSGLCCIASSFPGAVLPCRPLMKCVSVPYQALLFCLSLVWSHPLFRAGRMVAWCLLDWKPLSIPVLLQGIRAALLHCYDRLSPGALGMCPQQPQAWPRLLFCLAFFHAMVLERHKYGSLGWNTKYDFSDGDWFCARQSLCMFLNTPVSSSNTSPPHSTHPLGQADVFASHGLQDKTTWLLSYGKGVPPRPQLDVQATFNRCCFRCSGRGLQYAPRQPASPAFESCTLFNRVLVGLRVQQGSTLENLTAPQIRTYGLGRCLWF